MQLPPAPNANNTMRTRNTKKAQRKSSEGAPDSADRYDELASLLREIQSDITVSRAEQKQQWNDFKLEILSLIECKYKIYDDKINNLTSAMEHLSLEITKVKKIHSDIEKSFDFLSKDYEDMKTQIVNIQTNMDQIKVTTDDAKTMKAEINILHKEINSYQQKERLSNIEIIGVPETKNESLIDIVIGIAHHTGLTLSADDIDHVNRVQPRQPVKGRPKCIIAKLKSRLSKDKVISGLRQTRGITTKDLNISGEARQIFVNEHLTHNNKALLRKTKETARMKFFQYTWVKNCNIYVRKNDTSPALLIRSEEDIKKML